MRRLLPAVAGAAVGLAALAPGVAAADTFTAFAGADRVSPNPPDQYSANGFFRRTLSIHVGDRVRWQFRGFHTVTIPARGQSPPAFVLPDPQHPVAGQLDATGRPFWFNGQPSLAFNLRAGAPQGGTTYTGRRLVNSGVPQGPKPFTVRFARAGTFPYFCVVHPGMRGTVRVRPRSARIPSAGADAAARRREIARNARHGRRTAAEPTPAGTVDVGRSPRGERFTIDAFFPKAATVKAGGTLTFTMAGQSTQEIHTVTFRPASVGEIPFMSGPTTVNPGAAYPSDPPPAPLPPYDGTNHGNGFLNSGILDNVPATPSPNTTRVTFTKPGTYPYECVVHEGMDGTVTVTP